MIPFAALKRAWLAVAACLLLAAAGCGDPSSTHDGDAESHSGAALETRLRVRAEPVRRGKLESAGSVTGTVRAFHRAAVTAETQGRVVARSVEPGLQAGCEAAFAGQI